MTFVGIRDTLNTMATARKRSAKSAAIPQSAIGQTATALQALPEKEKEALSLREAVTHLQEPIRTALGRGYSYEEVTSMLADQGINISVFSLKRYLSLTRSKSEDGMVNGRGKAKTRRTRKSQTEEGAEASDQAEATSAAPAAIELAPEAEPKRRRKTKSEAPEKTKTAAKSKSTTRTTARSSAARGRKKSAG